MKRSFINILLVRAVLAASVAALAVSVSNSDNGPRECRPPFDGHAAHDNPGGGFLPRIPGVQAAGAEEFRPELTFEGFMPELNGGVAWLNSAPLSPKSLRGNVVLITFWTYTCINSLRTLPYVKEWSAKYNDSGLAVIGVHTPEFSFERAQPNVEAEMRAHGLLFPVVMDNNYEIWRAFSNEAWPAFYLVDAKGQIRYHHFGEGDYAEMERVIQELLKEKGSRDADLPVDDIAGDGIEAPPSADERSPESYVGYRLSQRFASPGGLKENQEKIYNTPERLSLNHWGLIGRWKVNGESADLVSAPGKIIFRFHSRDLHLVMAPSRDGTPIRFRVTFDGAAPGSDCGVDATPDGTGIIRAPRLYQLIRQKGQVQDRTFEIEFLDPGIQALDFTFG
jgi:thiol-disulfide isomerase/thioredoxin